MNSVGMSYGNVARINGIRCGIAVAVCRNCEIMCIMCSDLCNESPSYGFITGNS